MADRTSARLFGELFEKLADMREKSASKRAAVGSPEVQLIDDLVIWVWYQTSQYDFSPCQMDCDDALEELGLLRRSDDGGYEYGPEED